MESVNVSQSEKNKIKKLEVRFFSVEKIIFANGKKASKQTVVEQICIFY